MTAFFCLSFVLLFIGKLPYLALVGLAFGYSAVGTMMPVVVRYGFGERDYPTVWSRLLLASNIISFLGIPSWGVVYDTFDSYAPALMAMECPYFHRLLAQMIPTSIEVWLSEGQKDTPEEIYEKLCRNIQMLENGSLERILLYM